MNVFRYISPLIFFILFFYPLPAQRNGTTKIHEAAFPHYQDPVTDGAADPAMVWNRAEKSWWMLYTQHRANTETADIAYGNTPYPLRHSSIFIFAFNKLI